MMQEMEKQMETITLFCADYLGLYRVVLEDWKGRGKLLQSAGFGVESELLSVHSRGRGKGHDRAFMQI